MTKSESIQIVNSNYGANRGNYGHGHNHSSFNNIPISRTSELMYDSATWRMYRRIMNARRRRSAIATQFQSSKQEQLGAKRSAPSTRLDKQRVRPSSRQEPHQKPAHEQEQEQEQEFSLEDEKDIHVTESLLSSSTPTYIPESTTYGEIFSLDL